MAEFNPIRILRPKDSFHIPLVEEARLLSSYRNVAKLGLIGSATHLRFSPVAPYELAVSHNFNVSLINPDGGHVRKTLTRFRDFAYSPDFKQDGRLLVAGAGDGTAQVFDVANRSVLRAFRGHQG